jgi:hypothetical protein
MAQGVHGNEGTGIEVRFSGSNCLEYDVTDRLR